ncbi:hypothetical protein BDV59DRAFT_169417 [Aspergillus ambiguus]|uniref:uncharacterized protein n=1 Tax=Aspergillus ambiguus TaxID=176160 RepID=UPI003CCE0D55
MASILSLPHECILLTLKSCDSLSQIIALSSTCKLLLSIYSANAHSIFYSVGGHRDIPAFGDAVMALRATRIVTEHFLQGQLPPKPFPLDLLSADTHKLSVNELRQIRDWKHLVECIEDFCIHSTEWGREWLSYLKHTEKTADPPGNWVKWRESFHRSIYRSFLMGAVLCRVYQEPLVLSDRDDRPEHFLKDYCARLLQKDEPLLRNDEMVYLLKYPVFNFESYEDHEPVYGQLADFLVELSRRRKQSASTSLDLPTHVTLHNLDRDHANILYTETMQCLLASMTLLNHYYSLIFKDNQSPGNERLSREVTVVPLGSFYPEQILMPARVENAHETLLLETPLPLPLQHGTKQSSWNSSGRFMNSFLDVMHWWSGQPNHYSDDLPTPPPPLQVFQFIGRKFLGLRFSDDAFKEGEADATHILFVHHPAICSIYEDEWPYEVPSMFDTPDGGGEYNAYYLA